MNYKEKAIVLSVAAMLTSSAAFSLPDARSGNPLGSLGIETPSGVGDVVRDHELPNTLHVGPAATKEINGVYAELDSSGAQCTDYVNIRKQTYFSPVTPAQKEAAYLNQEYVSNFFQLTYAIPRANTDSLIAIREAREEVRNAGAVNADLTANYLSLKSQWTDIGITLGNLDDELDDLESDNTAATNLCVVLNASNPTDMVTCITNNMATYNAAKAEIDSRKDVANATKSSISQNYYDTKAEYEAVQAELELFQDDILFNGLIISLQMQITESAWDIEKDVLAAEEGKVVGRATAGYNLFDNETTLLAQALNSYGDFEVKKLDTFNIRLNTGVTLDNPLIETDNGQAIYTRNTWSFPADTLLQSNILSDWQMPFEREERGDTIHFDTMDSDSFGSGGVSFYVTKGARCGEYTQSVEETYSSTADSGIEVSWTVHQQLFEPQPDRVVFSESIGLTYDYYAYPGPLTGECSIDVDRMNSYWRNAGSSKSWSWFRSKTNSWDNTREVARDEMGMECDLDVKPLVDDPEAARLLEVEFEQHMYSDMWQMFLTVYAKEYTVEVLDPEITDPGKSTVGSTLGTGLMKICGANVYCQFGGVVLKALDEIGGSKASGTTSHTSTVYGKIWKRYNKDTFTVKQGSSAINLKVCVDASQCN